MFPFSDGRQHAAAVRKQQDMNVYSFGREGWRGLSRAQMTPEQKKQHNYEAAIKKKATKNNMKYQAKRMAIPDAELLSDMTPEQEFLLLFEEAHIACAEAEMKWRMGQAAAQGWPVWIAKGSIKFEKDLKWMMKKPQGKYFWEPNRATWSRTTWSPGLLLGQHPVFGYPNSYRLFEPLSTERVTTFDATKTTRTIEEELEIPCDAEFPSLHWLKLDWLKKFPSNDWRKKEVGKRRLRRKTLP